MENLDGVARDAAATAVVEWAAETSLILVVRVDVHVVVLTEAAEVVELEAGADDALLDEGLLLGHLVWLLVITVSTRHHALVLLVGLSDDLAVVLAQIALGFVRVTAPAHESLFTHTSILLRVDLRDLPEGVGDDYVLVTGALSMVDVLAGAFAAEHIARATVRFLVDG